MIVLFAAAQVNKTGTYPPITADVKTVYTHSSFLWRCGPTLARDSSFTRFPDHTQRRTTVAKTPLDE